MAKKATKKKEDKALNLESILLNCRDYLRGNASLNDKRDLLLTLVFLRFIGEKFEDEKEKMRQDCINNLSKPKYYPNLTSYYIEYQ